MVKLLNYMSLCSIKPRVTFVTNKNYKKLQDIHRYSSLYEL